VLLLAGCGSNTQDSLAPKSHQSSDIASLFWWMMGVAWFGLGLVVVLLLLSWWRRNRRGIGSDTDEPHPGERTGWYVVIGAGIVMPIVLISALFLIADIFVIRTTQAPAATATRLTVDVIGHQWWWEVRYPGTTAVTANEIHIPARTPVRVDVSTDDVIHSFWVPRLNRTIDMIPGRTNAIELYADVPGRYRGQCLEFCGLQHAHMSFYVFADPPAKFRRWLADEERKAAAPTTAAAREGFKIVTAGPCAECHEIRGTTAGGFTGPDLTHLESRTTLGAVTVPNTTADLRRWIVDSQELKPGNQMPNLRFSQRQLDAVMAYLQGLH
jgi:cytochrome c oxidase subunit 2